MNENTKQELLYELVLGYYDARKGKRKTCDENVFELALCENLVNLRDSILEKTYRPSRSVAFVTHRPVDREIFAAPFRDRVVHHYLYNTVADWWDRQFIYDSCSCRVGKGQLFAINRIEHHARSVSDNFKKEAWVIKLDIKGYFINMQRKLLYKLVLDGLDKQFPRGERGAKYYICKLLWRQVIFDDPVKGARKRGTPMDWIVLDQGKSLFGQKPGYGIVIGNLTSQLISNILLNELDRFVTMELGYKHYVRYVDDFCIIVSKEQKAQAIRDIGVIEEFLRTRLGLTLHPKKRYCQEIHKGVELVGARIYAGYKLPSKRVVAHFNQAMRLYMEYSTKVSEEVMVSYLGLLGHFKSVKVIRRACECNGLVYEEMIEAKKRGGNALKEYFWATREIVARGRTGELGM